MHPQSTASDATLRSLLLAKIAIYDDGCWDWQGSRDPGGYGRFQVSSQVFKTHQVAWYLANGHDLQDGYQVLHKCHHPRCCNPLHVYDGTPADNARDRRLQERDRYRTELAALTLQDCVAALYRVSPEALSAALLVEWRSHAG